MSVARFHSADDPGSSLVIGSSANGSVSASGSVGSSGTQSGSGWYISLSADASSSPRVGSSGTQSAVGIHFSGDITVSGSRSAYSLVIDGKMSGLISSARGHLVSACLSVLKSDSWSAYSSVYSAFLSLVAHWEVESAVELKAALVPRFFLLSDLSAVRSSVMILPQCCREFLGSLSMLDFSGSSSGLVFPLSISSVLIPFSSFNQSPRNIYQSSMAKQSVSLPVLFLRSFVQGFSLCQVQSPLARVFFHDRFANYSGGFNSLVAVVSYSGYDLEDAIVFSKGSVDAGLSASSLLRSFVIDLNFQFSSVGNLPVSGSALKSSRLIAGSHSCACVDGICSTLLSRWSSIPFSDASVVNPDVLLNPAAFPSRMTVGMLIESMSSSVAIVAGMTGGGFRQGVFLGSVYYQRLRHMALDKFQARSLGPVSILTRQPVRGRRCGGGVRFGVMERDVLLSHGAAILLSDRLSLSSDLDSFCCCYLCGSILGFLLLLLLIQAHALLGSHSCW